MRVFEIQDATLEDIPNIWKNIQSSFVGPHSPYVAIGQPGFENYLIDRVRSGKESDKKLIVAKIDGKFAAFVDVTLNDNASNFLTRIGVDSEFRGFGLARTLMGEIAERWGGGREWELDVFEGNSSALKLYQRSGFTVVETRAWIGRVLPPSPIISNAVFQDEKYKHYGFTTISFMNRAVSIAGNAIRCHSMDDFLDDRFLATMQEFVPHAVKVFTIVSSKDANRYVLKDSFKIATTYRMKGSFDSEIY